MLGSDSMEGVVFSNTGIDATALAIEQLSDLDCRNVWVWTATQQVCKSLLEEDWESNVRIAHDENIQSIGDCLRELYTRNDSRDNLLIVGDVERLPEKLTVHRNHSKKNCGTILFGQGDMIISVEKGALSRYEKTLTPLTSDTLFSSLASSASASLKNKPENKQDEKKARALDIAYCSSAVLALFFDNFDCNTFHDLLAAHPVGYRFQVLFDKRIKFYDSAPSETARQTIEDEEQTFESELAAIIAETTVHDAKSTVSKLELNALRLAYGKTFAQLIDAVRGRPDLLDILEH